MDVYRDIFENKRVWSGRVSEVHVGELDWGQVGGMNSPNVLV